MELRTLPSPGDVIAGRYQVESMLGHGGMGAAFAATNLVTGKRVALKWILRAENAGRLHRLLREAQAAGRIHHANIVNVYDVGQHQGSLFLVMELLNGQSLQAWIDEHGALSADQVIRWLLPAFRGIRAAHRRGVIHRDLKPANIFLCRDDDDAEAPLTAKVMDFGVSKIIAPQAARNAEPSALGSSAEAERLVASERVDHVPSLTDSGALIGTPCYMPPEQFGAARSVDERADVYACGVILYHALSGRRPFDDESYGGLVNQILRSDPIPLHELKPELPRSLCALVHAAMHGQREHRLKDIGALIEGLEPLPPTQSVAATGPALMRPVSARVRTRSLVLWALLALGILGSTPRWWSAAMGRGSSATVARFSHTEHGVPTSRPSVPDRMQDGSPPTTQPVSPNLTAERPAPSARHATSTIGVRRARIVRHERSKPQPQTPAVADPEQVIELGADEF